MARKLQLYNELDIKPGQGFCIRAGQRFVPCNSPIIKARSPLNGYAPRLHYMPAFKASDDLQVDPKGAEYLFDVQTFTAPWDGTLVFRGFISPIGPPTEELDYALYEPTDCAIPQRTYKLVCGSAPGLVVVPPFGLSGFSAGFPAPIIQVNEPTPYLWFPAPYQEPQPYSCNIANFAFIGGGVLIFHIDL